MSISYIYISFINIKTCDKYDASSSVNEQIKTYILTTGGGGRKYKNYLYSRPFGERKYKNFIFTIIFFLEGGGGGGGGGGKKKGRNKVLTFLLKKNGRENDCLLDSFS